MTTQNSTQLRRHKLCAGVFNGGRWRVDVHDERGRRVGAGFGDTFSEAQLHAESSARWMDERGIVQGEASQ